MCNAEVLYQQYYSLIGRLDPDDPTTPPEAAQQYCEDMAAARAAIIQHQRECRECRRDIVTPTAARARQDGEALPRQYQQERRWAQQRYRSGRLSRRLLA